jgi:hypothetical protein
MQPRRPSSLLARSSYPPSTLLGLDKLVALGIGTMRATSVHAHHASYIRFVTISTRYSFDEDASGTFEVDHIVPESEHRNLATLAERLCAAGRDREAMEQLVDVIEAKLRQDQNDYVEALLDALNPSALSPNVTVAVLTIIWYAKGDLKNWRSFFARAEGALRSKVGAERASALLATRR